MNMLKPRNKGASSVALIAIIIVLAVLIVGVWYLQSFKEEKMEESEKEQVRDCGVNDKMNDSGEVNNLEKDSVLTCLGEAIAMCEEARAVFEDSYKGPVLFEVLKDGEECKIKMSLSSAEEIIRETDKKYADKYIECPIEKIKEILEEDMEDPSMATNTGWGLNFYWVIGALALSSDSNKETATELGCTGTFLE